MNKEETMNKLFEQGEPVEFIWLSKEKLADIMDEYADQRTKDIQEELDQVKLSFHQAVEEVKRLTEKISGK